MVIKMNGTRKIFLVVVVGIMLALLSATVSATTFYGNESELWCYKAESAPTIDGVISSGEWTDGDHIYWYYTPETNHRDANIYIYAKWDDTAIYVGVDLCPDNSSENGDYCYVFLDEDHDGDWGYGDTHDHYFYVAGSSPTDGTVASKNDSGYATDDDVPIAMGYDTSPNANYNHRMIEFQINLTAINYTTPPSTMGILVTGYGTLAPNYFSTDGANATNYDDNETVANWTDLKLSNQYYIAGRITNDIMPMIIALVGVAVTISILAAVVKSLGRTVTRMK
jgi:hypothetical protein